MATKDDMHREILGLFDEYQQSFEEIKIDRLAFLKWLDAFNSYKDVQKLYRYFIRKLLIELHTVRRTLQLFDHTTWVGMKYTAPHQKEVVKLREVSKGLRTIWVERPKKRSRKGKL